MARTPTGDLFLLTPGPLTTAKSTKEAMVHDWGSRDPAFIALNRNVRAHLLRLIEGEGTHEAVMVQGSGTFAVEATVGTLVPRQGACACGAPRRCRWERGPPADLACGPCAGKALVVCNGAYGRRIVQMLKVMGRAHIVIDLDEKYGRCPMRGYTHARTQTYALVRLARRYR
jgi:2-aminoethylphosphonate-pyruvate transaminase